LADAVLCWDIDGTLLTTARAGIGAWEQALESTLDTVLDLESLPTAGLTDFEIGRKLLAHVGTRNGSGVLERLVTAYETFLPERLKDRRGNVLAGVREFLEWNAAHDRIPCILLTGNTRAGAAAKLRHYDLDAFFADGAFARLDDPDRMSIARRAHAIAEGLLGAGFPSERMVVIGDTPYDVNCGRCVGARTIAVASGAYGVEALTAAGSWRVLPAFPEPEPFLKLLA
jgi:phosphoglycolate phosphatase-like HAD superfamily hydrolase